jgi:hypothetical protein
MSEPTYSVSTERVYERLPEVYRTLDVQNEWQFKKYISSIVDQLGDIDVLVARLDYVPPEDRKDWYASGNEYNTYERPTGIEDPDLGFDPIYETSDLLDGRTADDAWLPYLGQLIGADLEDVPTADEKRDAIINNYLGFKAGSREALEAAVLSLLTGTKYSRVYPQRTGEGGSIFATGDQWDVLIVTKPEESPDSATILAKVISEGAKPAGVLLHHLSYTLTWEILEAGLPTWTVIDAQPNWTTIEAGEYLV